MNDFANILSYTWNLMCTPFVIYGFTLSYGIIYLFSLLSGLVAYALFKYLWG